MVALICTAISSTIDTIKLAITTLSYFICAQKSVITVKCLSNQSP